MFAPADPCLTRPSQTLFYFASPAFIQAKPYSLFTIIFTSLFRSPLCRCRPVARCKGRLPCLIRRLEVHSPQILPFHESVIGRETRRMKPCRQPCSASVKSRNGSDREKNRKKGKKADVSRHKRQVMDKKNCKSQANLTESFGLSIEEEQTVYGAMKGKYPLPLVETAGGVTVVPSCLDLSAAEAELINEPGRELILNGLIGKLLENRKFDYILIDCPPSLGLLTLNALTAADYLIIPVQAQFLAMRGMAKIMNVIATVQERLNPKLAIGGIVITQFDKRKTLNKSVAELVKDSFCEKVFKTVIRDNVSLAEAPIKGKNIFEYSRNSNGAKDYMALAQEVLKLK